MNSKGKEKLKEKLTKSVDIEVFNRFENDEKLWIDIHKKFYNILQESTTFQKSIEDLVDICILLVKGLTKSKIRYEDLHFAMEVFTDIVFIFEGGELLYDLFDKELYGLVETLDMAEDKEQIRQELTNFLRKHFPNKNYKKCST